MGSDIATQLKTSRRVEKGTQSSRQSSKFIASPCSTADRQPIWLGPWQQGWEKMLRSRKAVRDWEQTRTTALSLADKLKNSHPPQSNLWQVVHRHRQPSANSSSVGFSRWKYSLFGVSWKITGGEETNHTEITYPVVCLE